MKNSINLSAGNERGTNQLKVPLHLSALLERRIILAEVWTLRDCPIETQARFRLHSTRWTSTLHQNPSIKGLYLLVNFSGIQFTLGMSYYFGAGRWSIIECEYDQAVLKSSSLPVMSYDPEQTYWKGLSADPDSIELG